MINVMRAVASAAAVQAPAIINCADTQFPARGSPVCFRVRDLLTGVLRYLPAAMKRSERETAFTFNRGFFDCQTWRQLEFHKFLRIVTQTEWAQGKCNLRCHTNKLTVCAT